MQKERTRKSDARRRRRKGTDGRATAKMLMAWDIQYITHDGSLLRIGPVWTQEKCRHCIELCEQHGVWSSDESATYPFATCDIEVDKVEALRGWLVSNAFVNDLQRIFWLAHRTRVAAFDDLFVVRYQAEEGGQVKYG